MPPADVSSQLRALLSGGAQAIPADELEAKLEAAAPGGRPLRVKLGIDPSTPDLHLGHAVVLGALRRFQDLGHTAVLIVGDFTGRIGDPSGQSETRPQLGPDELEANARTYLDQAGKVLDVSRAELRRNSEWLAPLSFADVAGLASTLTVARLLERDDFAARHQSGRPIGLVEFLYPLMQGYDSVAVEADVEIGGTDQTFNLLVGRDIQRAHGLDPQVAFTVPLLTGTDGERKMSKSLGNHVGLTDEPEEQFGKVMSIPDELMPTWFRLCTRLDPSELGRVEQGLADGSLHPAEQKRRLAREIVALYHGAEAARTAEEQFDRMFKDHQAPAEVPEVVVSRSEVLVEKAPGVTVVFVPALLVELGLATSRSDARRLIEQEGVRRDGTRVEGLEQRLTIPEDDLLGSVWQVGRRRFAKVKAFTET
jgi:tyrosyl-tRNA synthetase